jgi:hypothetical protein
MPAAARQRQLREAFSPFVLFFFSILTGKTHRLALTVGRSP